MILKNSLCIVILLFVLFYNQSSYAGVWSQQLKVNKVYTHADGGVFLRLVPYNNHPNPNNCTSSSWIRVGPAQANVKDIYKMSLTAQAADLPVSVYIEGCDGKYPKILHMMTIK